MSEESAKINDDTLEQVTGGINSNIPWGENNNIPWGIKFNELDGRFQDCARNGYCPNCNTKRKGEPWEYFQQYNLGYDCDICDIYISTV